jgi:hypothetical protein
LIAVGNNLNNRLTKNFDFSIFGVQIPLHSTQRLYEKGYNIAAID